MLHVHRAERADRLADGLAATLLEPLNDPFAPEIVAVPTRGIERWLTQRLRPASGERPVPQRRRVRERRVPVPGAADPGCSGGRERHRSGQRPLDVGALGVAAARRSSTSAWAIRGSPPLARHLEGARGDPEDPMRRFGAVRHIAELFDRYSVQRPDLIRAWERGDQTGDWQSELWRRLRERIGAPSPAERLKPACERIRDEPGVARASSPAVAVRAHADPALAPRASGRDRAPARPAPVRAPPVAGALADHRRRAAKRPADRAPARRPDRDRAGQPAARVVGSRRARAAACARERRRGRRSPLRRCRRPNPTTLLARSRRTSARTASRRARPAGEPDRRPALTSRPQRSRSTPATAAPARSRCSATSSCTCSRTTRRSSRATSS